MTITITQIVKGLFMISEENGRKLTGATARDTSLDLESIDEWSDASSSLNYASCPEQFKNLIENVNLDELVYWKLNDKFEKSTLASQDEILKDVIADVERPLFAIVLNKTNGNQSRAAEMLGCNRNTLHRKLKEFLINPREMKKSSKTSSSKKNSFPKSTIGFKNISQNSIHKSVEI